MRIVQPVSLLILAAVLVAGCAARPSAPVSDSLESPADGSLEHAARAGIKQALYRQHDRWQGTRYRVGGTGGRGFDCSGLTYTLYRETFDTHLPRTTTEQARIGRPVERDELAPGDLVFFKTGIRQRHVGIYVDDGLFLHASRSEGVRLSSLRQRYWRKRYWQARRLQGI